MRLCWCRSSAFYAKVRVYADGPRSKARAHLRKLCLQHAPSRGGRSKSRSRSKGKPVALYSVSIKPISRSSGRSATAAAAYRNAERITDERTGEIHDYSRRSGVNHVEAFAPQGLMPQASAELWNKAEAAEVRSNARVAREVLVALPHELDQEQRRELARSIAQSLADRYGTAGTLAVHDPDRDGDNRNHHVHILMTTRRLEVSGQLGSKTRELDDVKKGPQEIEWIRMLVEDHTNNALEYAGLAAQVDRRSLVNQRQAALNAGDIELAEHLNRPATLHEGPRVTQIRREAARQGRMPLGALDRAAANDQSRQLVADRAELGQVSAQIIDFEKAWQVRDAREKAEAMVLDGMAAFRARFDHSLAISAEVEAERQRVELELKRVAQEQEAERVREWHRQQEARDNFTRQAREREAPKHRVSPAPGRDGPDFSM